MEDQADLVQNVISAYSGEKLASESRRQDLVVFKPLKDIVQKLDRQVRYRAVARRREVGGRLARHCDSLHRDVMSLRKLGEVALIGKGEERKKLRFIARLKCAGVW